MQSHVTVRYQGHVTNKSVISPLSQGLCTPNLAGWGLRMRRPHPQSHVTLRYRGHVINQKRYISTFTRPMYPKLRSVVTLDDGTPPTKSRDSSTTWSRDKSNTLYLHFHKVYGSQTQLETSYSVVVTMEVCEEGNWLIQVSGYIYPPLSKKV